MADRTSAPNLAQQKAIRTIRGPVLLFAGPGTGKTFTLTERIIYLLHHDIPANQILALTFTENAAMEMHARLEQRMGFAGRQVLITTFHSFCQRLIQRYPEIFEVKADVRALDPATQYEIIQNALECHPLQFLKTERGDRFYYVSEIVSKISLVKREAIRSEKFHAAVNTLRHKAEALQETVKTAVSKVNQILKHVGKLTEFWKIYEDYNKELARRNLTDFDDMILRVANAFRKQPDFLESIQKQYRYIHADEFQDNNSAQNEILYGLAGEDPNLFVVGDDDQSIFRFQGACAKNFVDFLQQFPNATIMTLNENYRSTPSILNFVHAQISLGKDRLETRKGHLKISKRLTSSTPTFQKLRTPVRLIACNNRWDEIQWIADEIVRLKIADPSLKCSDFAILFRLNREAHEFGMLLKQREIPFRIGISDNALTTPAVQNLLAILRAVVKPENSATLCHAVLFPPFGISPSDLVLMNQLANSQQVPLWNILESELSSLTLKQPQTIAAFRERFTTWRLLFSQRNLYHAFLDLLHQSGILEFHLHPIEKSENNKIDVGALNALQKVARSLEEFVLLHPTAHLSDWLQHLDLMERYGIALEVQADDPLSTEGRVQLLTTHKAKGSEFRVVFVTNTCATNWEQKAPRRDLIPIPSELVFHTLSKKTHENESDEEQEEERRLLYVATTRASERLYLTRPMWREEHPLDESFLLAPLKQFKNLPAVWEEIPSGDSTETQLQQLATLPQGDLKSAFYLERIQKLRLSPTALHRYEVCPRQFLYAHLYLIPTKTDRYLAYGSAIHEALRRFFISLRQQRAWPPLDLFIQDFLNTLKHQILENAYDYQALEEMGRRELPVFHEWCLQQSPSLVAETELAIRNVSIPLNPQSSHSSPQTSIPLSGKFDRIDLASDGSWIVVDYKTGRPRSENEFFGKTKNSDGRYWNQFRFYKLLNQLSKEQPPIKKGRVIYIQDPTRSHDFELTEQHAAEIRNKIEEVNTRIQSLDFHRVSETQSAEPCQRCAYIGPCRANL